MKFLPLIAFLAASAPAPAALPPYWDSVRRIEAVTSSAELGRRLVGPIVSIRIVSGLQYEIRTTVCSAKVTLKARVPDRPGPTSYTVQSIDRVACP